MSSNPSSAPTVKPIALTEQQALAASYPLPPDRRSDFLAACARALAGLPEGLGHGSVHRTIARVQREYFDPPHLTAAACRALWER